MIYLTGAGCGDWELLTLRAMRMIQKADCILYDRLLDPEILTFAPKHCDCIYVGKSAGQHAMAQEKIQQLMIEKAAQYDIVVRLKGGDPCVFGRVGEEAQALAQAGIPFEIIPGISSGIGGLAFAGIPITHRDYASGVRIMSAHGKADIVCDLDYAGMAHTRDTLIFYMGLRQLSAIVAGLLQAGRDPKTPIALVSNASRATQTMVTATLQDIESRNLSAIVSPALIVVGEVVRLQEELNFMKRRPLFQKRYLLPQFADALRELQLQLQDFGASVDCVTTGRICANPALLDTIDIKKTDVLVFSSRNAIEIFFTQLLQQKLDFRQLFAVKIAVVGEKSRQVLARYGIQADIQPEQEDSEHLALELKKHIQKSDRIVLVKADNDNHVLLEQLQAYAHVSLCKAYTVEAQPFALPQHVYDGVLFTCSYHVHACLKRLMMQQDVTRLKVYSMGSHTTKALRSYGCKQIIELPKADKGLFGACIIEEEAHV